MSNVVIVKGANEKPNLRMKIQNGRGCPVRLADGKQYCLFVDTIRQETEFQTVTLDEGKLAISGACLRNFQSKCPAKHSSRVNAGAEEILDRDSRSFGMVSSNIN